MVVDIGMIAADTSRSRAYLQALIRHGLLPGHVLVLENPSSALLPGQMARDTGHGATGAWTGEVGSDCWSEADFDPTIPLRELLDGAGITHETAPSQDINDEAVIAAISRRPESVLIYSGYGGVLLHKNVLATGKRFLHIHGGYLPAYKGSTTNFYSLLAENAMGASAIFLTEQIDSGPILLRREFPPPADRTRIDHVFDSAVRAKVLVEVLGLYAKTSNWDVAMENKGGDTYYIIHPVLKHLAIMAIK